MKIGVIGHEGNLGSALVDQGCTPMPIDDINGHNSQFWRDFFCGYDVDVVVNCVAVTAVDKCEEPEFYQQKVVSTNALSVADMADAAIPLGKRFFHLSTDYVFGGRNGPYAEVENDELSLHPSYFDAENDLPVNSYGLSKLGGEAAVSYWLPSQKLVIIRTTGLFGGKRADIVDAMRNALTQYQPFFAAVNLFGNQTYVPFLAQQIIQLAEIDFYGTINLSSQDVMNRYSFAKMAALELGLDHELIHPIMSEQIVSWVAKRPVHGGLKTDLSRRLGIFQYTAFQGLSEAIETGRYA